MTKLRHPGERGFTLLELCAALALAALLLAVIGTLLPKLANGVEPPPTRNAIDEDLVDRLAEDLQSLESYAWQDDGSIELSGRYGRDPETQLLTHSEATVVYTLQNLGREKWLCRAVIDAATEASRLSLLGVGVQRIDLVVSDPRDGEDQVLVDEGPLPRLLRLRVTPTGDGPPFERLVVREHAPLPQGARR